MAGGSCMLIRIRMFHLCGHFSSAYGRSQLQASRDFGTLGVFGFSPYT
jgi:hypothetical protein